MQHDNDFDVSRIDHRSLSPAQWTALKAEVFRRARIQRGEVICSGIAWAWRGFWRLLKWSALRAAWISLVRNHRERVATAQLRSLSDQEPKDIGLPRREIDARAR
jgi:uncharacterized protein YjiS (DUF1127 family)